MDRESLEDECHDQLRESQEQLAQQPREFDSHTMLYMRINSRRNRYCSKFIMTQHQAIREANQSTKTENSGHVLIYIQCSVLHTSLDISVICLLDQFCPSIIRLIPSQPSYLIRLIYKQQRSSISISSLCIRIRSLDSIISSINAIDSRYL
jgi:hypothetical protein